MQPATKVSRENSFDSLRLIFASLVIVTHSFALLRLADPLEVLSNFRYDLGKLGVTGFFAISGYLVTQSWLRRPSMLRFLSARALRILPAFWVSLGFSVFITALVTAHVSEFLSSNITWRWVWWNAIFIWRGYAPLMPGAFENNPFAGGSNGSLWTLTYELHCYGAVLLIGIGTLVIRHRWIWAVVAAVLLFFYFKLIVNGGSLYQLGYQELYLAFATGMVIASLGYCAAAYLILCAGAVAAFFQLTSNLDSHTWYASLQMTLAMLIVFLGRSKAFTRLTFRSGDYSYGLYVYAFPIQQLVIALLGKSATPLFVCLLTLAFVLPVAVASWHILEKQALKVLNLIDTLWASRSASPQNV